MSHRYIRTSGKCLFNNGTLIANVAISLLRKKLRKKHIICLFRHWSFKKKTSIINFYKIKKIVKEFQVVDSKSSIMYFIAI